MNGSDNYHLKLQLEVLLLRTRDSCTVDLSRGEINKMRKVGKIKGRCNRNIPIRSDLRSRYCGRQRVLYGKRGLKEGALTKVVPIIVIIKNKTNNVLYYAIIHKNTIYYLYTFASQFMMTVWPIFVPPSSTNLTGISLYGFFDDTKAASTCRQGFVGCRHRRGI